MDLCLTSSGTHIRMKTFNEKPTCGKATKNFSLWINYLWMLASLLISAQVHTFELIQLDMLKGHLLVRSAHFSPSFCKLVHEFVELLQQYYSPEKKISIFKMNKIIWNKLWKIDFWKNLRKTALNSWTFFWIVFFP